MLYEAQSSAPRIYKEPLHTSETGTRGAFQNKYSWLWEHEEKHLEEGADKSHYLGKLGKFDRH